MSCVAFVTSNAHYRNNVHAMERTSSNFIRDDKYLAERADHLKMIKAREIIKKGPSASRHSRHHQKSKDDFQYTMNASEVDKLEETKPEIDSPVKTPKKIDQNDTTPVRQGLSPEQSFVRQAVVVAVPLYRVRFSRVRPDTQLFHCYQLQLEGRACYRALSLSL